MSKVIYKFILSILVTIGVFTTFLFFNNGKDLIIDISIPSKDSLRTQIYYATDLNAPFSEKKKIVPYKQENSKYFFDISKIKNIKKLRFDPEIHKDLNMTISSIKVIKNVWFQKSIYKVPFSVVNPKSGVSNFKKSNIIQFTTTNLDPQLSIEPKFILSAKAFNIYLEKWIFSIVITLIIFFLYDTIKNQKNQEDFIAKLILYSLFFFFISFKSIYYKEHVQYGYPPDEAAHLSYIKYVHNHHDFVTNFKELPNYLTHPSLYYELENLSYDKTIDGRANVDNFRNFSISIFILSVLLLLGIGFKSKLTILGHFVYLSIIASVPMFAYIGGSINNDNLALLGGAIFAVGFKRLIDKKVDNIAFLLISLGGAIAYFSKLTAALLIFFALIYYAIYTRKELFSKIKLSHIIILVIFLLPVLYYQISIMLEFHRIVPTYDVTHPADWANSGMYTQPQYRIHLSALEWFYRMIHFIQAGWFGIHSHHSFGHSKWLGVFGIVTLHILAILAIFLGCKNNKNFCILGKITLLALFTVEFIQYLFSYKAHINTGYMGGLQPRYLLPFMFGFAIMASIFVEKFKKYFWWNILIIFISIQAIYSDFFYFLLYYK